MNQIIGIDPGKQGAICVLYPTHIAVIPMPNDLLEVRSWWTKTANYLAETFVCIENVWKPITLVRDAGILEGLFLGFTYFINVHRVSPSTWRKTILGNYRASKQDAIEYCKIHYPDYNLFRSNKSKMEDHNFAEAICIAEFAKLYYEVKDE